MTTAPPGPLVHSDEHPWQLCKHPDDRIEWRRDPVMSWWVGICRRCGIGRTMPGVRPPIIRTDEQLANGECPPIPAWDRYVAATMPSLNYEPW